MGQLLSELRNTEAKRSKSAKRIAEYVLTDPAVVIDMSIASLAGKVGVSEPTINRFCTGLGLKGFPDFKLQLAGELARREFHVAQNIDPDDSCASVMAKIFESAHASLHTTLQNLDAGAIEQAAATLQQARSITICGQGASSSVALDAQHKLLRFDIPVIAHLDNLNQRMAATGLRDDDCLICISYTGRTIPIIEIAKMGRGAGATVIGITAAGSKLAAQCDLVLPVESGEDTEIYTPMTSRIAQLTVIDVLSTRLAMLQPDTFPEDMKRMKQSVQKTRIARASEKKRQ